jgi:hypothetical protein
MRAGVAFSFAVAGAFEPRLTLIMRITPNAVMPTEKQVACPALLISSLLISDFVF